MALYRIKDFDPNYRDYFDKDDVIGYDLYSRNEKVGSVEDILVDHDGQFRYLVVNTGLWIFGKKVLLPIGRARFDYNDRRIYADTLSKDQVQALPEFNDNMVVDFEHEEAVRKVYRSSAAYEQKSPAGYGVGYAGADSAPLNPGTSPTLPLDVGYDGYDRDTYTYDRDADLYTLTDEYHTGLKPYQERLRTSRTRR